MTNKLRHHGMCIVSSCTVHKLSLLLACCEFVQPGCCGKPVSPFIKSRTITSTQCSDASDCSQCGVTLLRLKEDSVVLGCVH
jgi:hypothetical protein